MTHYCTYFDKQYLSAGLSLYQSLSQNTDSFTLFVLCMDEHTYRTLSKLNYDNIVFIDSLDIARSFVPHLYSYSQKNLCKIFNIVQNNAHRALGDVEDLEKVYYTIVNYGIGKFKYDKDLLQNPQKIFDRVYDIYS